MAFIREYSNASGDPYGRPALGLHHGDPFSLRVPKKLRKLKIGRALGSVASFALGAVPGVGAILSPLAQRVVNLGRQYGLEDSDALAFARSYGIDVGDPGPAPKPAQKRKAAGSGPKAKAAKKAQKRAAPHAAPKQSAGSAVGENLKHAAGSTIELGKKFAGGDFAGAIGTILGGGKAAMAHAGMGGGHRRSMNPANVRALRRSIRRIEGFEKLVKRVEKAFPRIRRTHGAHVGGHRAGCRCVACRRK